MTKLAPPPPQDPIIGQSDSSLVTPGINDVDLRTIAQGLIGPRNVDQVPGAEILFRFNPSIPRVPGPGPSTPYLEPSEPVPVFPSVQLPPA
jgi:hypothetical protein